MGRKASSRGHSPICLESKQYRRTIFANRPFHLKRNRGCGTPKKTDIAAALAAAVIIAILASSGCIQSDLAITPKATHAVKASVYYVERGGIQGTELQVHLVYSSEGEPEVKRGVRHWAVFATPEKPPQGALINCVLVYDGESPFSGNPHMPQHQWEVTEYERIR